MHLASAERCIDVRQLAAYLPEEGLVLMRVEVASQENKIVSAAKLVQALYLRGKVVNGDAMHTQCDFLWRYYM